MIISLLKWPYSGGISRLFFIAFYHGFCNMPCHGCLYLHFNFFGAFQGQQSLAVFFKVRQEHPSYWIFLNKNHTGMNQWLGKPKEKQSFHPQRNFLIPLGCKKLYAIWLSAACDTFSMSRPLACRFLPGHGF